MLTPMPVQDAPPVALPPSRTEDLDRAMRDVLSLESAFVAKFLPYQDMTRLPPGFAAGTVALAFGIAASSLFPAIMMGIFSKKMNKEGAIAGMLAGLFVTLFYVFAHKGILFIKGTEYLGLIGGANSFFGITPEAIGAVGAMVNFAVAFIVDKFTKEPPAHIQAMVEAVRVPRGSGQVTGAH